MMHRFRSLLLIGTALMPLALTSANAGPNGGVVVGGSATINNPGSANVTVNQHTDKAIINWNLFNIGVGEKTTFSQPNTNSIVLNKVTGGMGPSQILGSLEANGKVFLINRDGIIFGAGAVVTTAGFLATTSDIKNEDFMAGRFNFQIPGKPDASIVNMGTITATNGGFAALVAPGVRNSGIITARLGTVALGAGNLFNLDFYGDRLITLGVGDQIATQVKDVATGQTLKSLITNDGKLKANGGRVELTAAAARHVVDSVINTSGVIEANSVGTKNGQIVLSAATASSSGGAGTRGGGSTASTSGQPPQTVKVSGTLSAAGKKKGTKGGSIIVTGENIEVAGATIDASGRDGGGKVLIGGDWAGGKPDKSLVNNQSAQLESFAIANATTVSVDAATKIDVSAKDRGDGGKVILWADHTTSFAGTILALGGREFGNGGFAEVSGKAVLNYIGTADLRAPSGQTGTLLLDPLNYTIWSGVGPPPTGSAITNTDLQNQLALASVIITTLAGVGDGDIFVNAPIVWNAATTLTLNAFRHVIVAFVGGASGAIQNTGAGNLVIHADNTGTGFGTLTLNPGTDFQRINWTGSTGTVTLYYNPTAFGTQDNFTSGNGHIGLATPSQLTQYMLVNNATNLQNMGVNLAGNYALHKNIDASLIPNFAPVGGAGSPFTGRFDGLGNTISNLTIAPVAASPGSVSIGMFGTIGATGHVNNLNIANASVTANPNVTGPGQFIGVLAGSNGGTVANVTVTNSTVLGGAMTGVVAGGLVGQNAIFGPGASMGAITMSSAQTNVTVGDGLGGMGGGQNSAGGLVGGNPGTITESSASGNVSGGAFSFVGGLVGVNGPTGTINSTSLFTFSGASGNVSLSDASGAAAGGLVGFNFGAISNSIASGNVTGGNSTDISTAGNIGGLVGLQDVAGTINVGIATGNVSAGTNSTVGGLVGFNNGTIGSSLGRPVFGFASVSGGSNFTGGLVGFNSSTGNITASLATYNVTGGGFATGGFAGVNMGAITGSTAFGNVSDTGSLPDKSVGGFVGSNHGSILASFAFGNVSGSHNAGGFAGSNESGGTIDTSVAGLGIPGFPGLGTVTVAAGGTAGGFVSGNHGTITNSMAFGNVTGGSNTILGGFAAGNLDGGTISDSTASGAVSSTGPNSIVGGFAGVSLNEIVRVTSSGAVSGTSESYLGGLVGINFAKITDSTTSSTVTGSGSGNVAGGLVGVNFGFIDPSFSTGNVSSGDNSVVGIFVGANAAIRFPDGMQLIGTVSSDSSGSGTASGGPGSTIGGQVGQSYPTSGAPDLPTPACEGQDGGLCNGTLFNPNGSGQDHPKLEKLESLLKLVAMVKEHFEEKKQEEVINTNNATGPGSSPGGQKGGGQSGGPGGARPPAFGAAPFGLGPLPTGMPPLTETRFLSNEVVMQLGGRVSSEELAALARRLGLEITYREQVALLGRTIIRFRITGGMAVRDVIAAVEKALGANFSMQPSYAYNLVQDVAQSGAAPADTTRRGDSAQYIVEKLGLVQAHLIATGKNIKVAVIDSEIDSKHPDLEGTITGTYDALPSDDQTAHPHGTGMAGAIASHKRLLGVAPGAQLLAVRAFGVNSGGAQGTSLNIVKGLQWAVDQGAKVINMSFAGPRDPILQQAMKRLTDQGIILIAAAGNAGPKSPPLYPGADPSVIAVSATDVDDKTYKSANRGKYIAIAAPGVDILVPAPEGGYQLTTGTSVAAAHISGVVALLLERDGSLRPETVRSILSSTAKNVGAPRNDLGSGLVDPVKALSKVGPKQAQLR